jgi:predicted metalloendopeptidase
MIAFAMLVAAQTATTVPSAVHGVQPADMDVAVKVTSPANLYPFANGEWLKANKLPPDKSYIGSFDVINERNLAVLRKVSERFAEENHPLDTPEGMVGLMYRIAMDEPRAERLGANPVRPELQRIDRIKTRQAILEEVARLDQFGLAPGFSAGVSQDDKDIKRMLFDLGQGGLTLPDRELYLRSDARSKALRARLVETFGRLLKLGGQSHAVAQANQALEIETALARVSSTPVELRDPESNYHLLSQVALVKLGPSIRWPAYFHALGIAPPAVVNVSQPRFLQGFARLVSERPIGEWRAYLRCHWLQGMAPYLSSAFVDADFKLGQAIDGVKVNRPRWKRAIAEIDSSIGEALGRLYVEAAFSPDAKAKALDLVRNVMAALRMRIGELDWMGPETKRQALVKLDSMTIKVGYPDKWRSYAGLRLQDDSWAQNVLRANQFEWERDLHKLGRPIDRTEWGMTPPTVNAYYNPDWNEIVFPAGILQPGFFDPEADDASNYGAIGAIIGHEMTHGFDDQGAQYDATGARRDWWTPEDKRRFTAKANQIVAQYDGYRDRFGLKINGRLTLGENIADVGGLAIAHLAYLHSLGGSTPPDMAGYTGEQRFFIAWGQNYKSHETIQLAKVDIATDPHSPDEVRVQGAISDNAAFYRAFGLPVPSKLPGLW